MTVSGSWVENCYNIGNIKGVGRYNGCIIGMHPWNNDDYIKLKNSYNAGSRERRISET